MYSAKAIAVTDLVRTDNMNANAISAVCLAVAGCTPLWSAEATPSTGQKDVFEMGVDELVDVRISPFDVSTQLDNGYRAAHSVSGSRFDAPIQEIGRASC